MESFITININRDRVHFHKDDLGFFNIYCVCPQDHLRNNTERVPTNITTETFPKCWEDAKATNSPHSFALLRLKHRSEKASFRVHSQSHDCLWSHNPGPYTTVPVQSNTLLLHETTIHSHILSTHVMSACLP